MEEGNLVSFLGFQLFIDYITASNEKLGTGRGGGGGGGGGLGGGEGLINRLMRCQAFEMLWLQVVN